MKQVTMIFRYKTFLIGLAMVVSICVTALFANQLAPYSYQEMNMAERLSSPSITHWFGTDQMGRDILSRVIYGTRLALLVAFAAMVIQGAIGIGLGLVAGYFGKLTEKVISFLTYLTLSLPALVVIIALITVLGPNLLNAIIAVSLVAWAGMTRIVTIKTMAIKSLPFIDAARSYGENDLNIIFRYILPNILPIVIILLSISLPSALVLTSSISFLGIGAQPPTPEWGSMVSEGLNYIMDQPWISILPGVVLAYTILGFNLLGEGLIDLLDPTTRA